MSITPLPTIRKRSANKLANTNYVNEVADVVTGQSPFGRSGQDGVFAPPWQQGYPIKITAPAGFGNYKISVGEWKPGAYDPTAQLTLDDLADYSDGVTGYLLNQGESEIAKNRVVTSKTLIGWLLFIMPESDLPVFGLNYSHAVRFDRFKEDTGEFQNTTHDAAAAGNVADADWETWHQAEPCGTDAGTAAVAEATVTATAVETYALAYSMALNR